MQPITGAATSIVSCTPRRNRPKHSRHSFPASCLLFAGELREAGYRVPYTKFDDEGNAGPFTDEVARAVAELRPSRICVTDVRE
ncbi:cryptochrome/photolyase family protein [Agrobacterium tumefaciens]|uniref:cryptochrome/photolyase family protein n=1 Tax=Agrobacterium tumefaciens TaxID=358 RepID=UPI0015728BE5|nr:cryptochrome/photolyase family protein [Agrobacterium tumefaciens]MDX8327425.1 cryptochrome/photolyase family protein [Agrobacterium tumefaciens]NSY61671.1 cryptochrome/photolyase family protein [Agrobacterium tumefaciens]NSZ76769.1 cryptochrome/photolyase family protein [Agrobacterium tumefaciens]